VKEEDIEKAVSAIKAVANKAIFVEPTGFTSRFYCRNHDYEKLFKVIEKIQLPDKTIFVCDLS